MQTQVDISALPVAREAALGLADVPIYLPTAAEAAAAALVLYKANHITQRIAEKKPYLMRELAASTECVPKTRDRFLHTRTISPFGKEIRHTRLGQPSRENRIRLLFRNLRWKHRLYMTNMVRLLQEDV